MPYEDQYFYIQYGNHLYVFKQAVNRQKYFFFGQIFVVFRTGVVQLWFYVNKQILIETSHILLLFGYFALKKILILWWMMGVHSQILWWMMWVHSSQIFQSKRFFMFSKSMKLERKLCIFSPPFVQCKIFTLRIHMA